MSLTNELSFPLLSLSSGLLLPKCVKILSINVPLDDPTKAERNYGLHADKKKAVLSHHPGIFKIHKGLSVEKGTVSLESLYHPGYFLRHKNYKFHLEKKVDKPIFSECYLFLESRKKTTKLPLGRQLASNRMLPGFGSHRVTCLLYSEKFFFGHFVSSLRPQKPLSDEEPIL